MGHLLTFEQGLLRIGKKLAYERAQSQGGFTVNMSTETTQP